MKITLLSDRKKFKSKLTVIKIIRASWISSQDKLRTTVISTNKDWKLWADNTTSFCTIWTKNTRLFWENVSNCIKLNWKISLKNWLTNTEKWSKQLMLWKSNRLILRWQIRFKLLILTKSTAWRSPKSFLRLRCSVRTMKWQPSSWMPNMSKNEQNCSSLLMNLTSSIKTWTRRTSH